MTKNPLLKLNEKRQEKSKMNKKYVKETFSFSTSNTESKGNFFNSIISIKLMSNVLHSLQ